MAEKKSNSLEKSQKNDPIKAENISFIFNKLLKANLPNTTLCQYHRYYNQLNVKNEIGNLNLWTALCLSVIMTGIKKGDPAVLKLVYEILKDMEGKNDAAHSLGFDKLLIAIKNAKKEQENKE